MIETPRIKALREAHEMEQGRDRTVLYIPTPLMIEELRKTGKVIVHKPKVVNRFNDDFGPEAA